MSFCLRKKNGHWHKENANARYRCFSHRYSLSYQQLVQRMAEDIQNKARVAIFASGNGSNAEALLHGAFRIGSLYTIALVVSNNSQCGAMQVAAMYDIPLLHISTYTHPDSAAYTRVMLKALRRAQTDIIALAGYMKKLPSEVITVYKNRVLNIHPALLPQYGGKGMFGKYVHEAVLAAGESATGVTVHQVEGEYDTGAILAQEKVPVVIGDTVETLSERVRVCEHTLYPKVVQQQAALFLQHSL